jgi:hypothetical protein
MAKGNIRIKCVPKMYIYSLYLLLNAIVLMNGGSVYKDHAFNKKTAHTSHENSTIHGTNFHSTIQVYEHPQYNTST